MSEDNQENGTANGDVPEIELIIKDEIKNVEDLDTVDTDSKECKELIPLMPVKTTDDSVPTNDQFLIFELKSNTEPMYNYVITHVKPPPQNDGDLKKRITSDSVEYQKDQSQQSPPPYVISVQIPVEEDKDEAKENANSVKLKRAFRRKKLAEALDAVVNKQLTISKAASVFEVTKSTLWRQVNKYTNHRRKKVDEELNKRIADRICSGESLSVISKSLKVAKSTLHQHKVRLAQRGQLPPNVPLKTPTHPAEKLAMKERIIQASRGCRVNGMSIRFAAKFFSIPPSTLWKHIRRFQASQKRHADIHQESIEVEPIEVKIKLPDEDTDEDGNVNEDENANNEEKQVKTSPIKEMDLNDFDVDAYCERPEENTSDDGDFLISFDFETFESYVKREFD